MPTNSPFFEKSKEIANAYLQSIVFIDDKAYSGLSKDNPNHDFDAQKVSMAFAKEQKICAIYSPQSEQDIHNIKLIVKKADIIILDWQIILQNTNVGNPEADAETEDPRGKYTLQIIKDIVQDSGINKNALKLIIVYTGETNLEDISANIQREINTNDGIDKFELESCKLFSKNIKILVRAKSSVNDGETDTKFNHLPELKDKIVKYEDLPSFILKEFTEMTYGLLSNFTLLALTTLRDNSSKLIGLYCKDLDDAFFAHRLFLPTPNDSKEQLIEVLSQSIQSLLNYNDIAEKSISKELIEYWIDTKKVESEIEISKQKIKINNDFLKEWSDTNFVKAVQSIHPSIDQNKIDSKFSEWSKDFGSKFLTGVDSKLKDFEFSILTHHKSNFKNQSTVPKLSLGSILLMNQDEYYLCIQAKCDSVRIVNGTRFLFLPLKPVTERKKFQFIIQNLQREYIKLNVLKDSHELRTIKFNPSQGLDYVSAELYDDSNTFYFSSTYSERLIWICDLKDLHAQRIANLYASQLSRVGLDESEWLRRWGS